MNTTPDYPVLPQVTTSVLEYGAHNAIILLERNPEKGMIYNVSTEPAETATKNLTIINFTMSSAHLTVSYNTYHNVSITATSCGQKSIYTLVELHYGKFITGLVKLKLYFL